MAESSGTFLAASIDQSNHQNFSKSYKQSHSSTVVKLQEEISSRSGTSVPLPLAIKTALMGPPSSPVVCKKRLSKNVKLIQERFWPCEKTLDLFSQKHASTESRHQQPSTSGSSPRRVRHLSKVETPDLNLSAALKEKPPSASDPHSLWTQKALVRRQLRALIQGRQNCLFGGLSPPTASKRLISQLASCQITEQKCQTEGESGTKIQQPLPDSPPASTASSTASESFEWPNLVHQLLPKPYRCLTAGCTDCFTRKSHLLDHLRKHLGIKPFSCLWPDCEFASVTIEEAFEHVHSTHVCHTCDTLTAEQRAVMISPCGLIKADAELIYRLPNSQPIPKEPFFCQWPHCAVPEKGGKYRSASYMCVLRHVRRVHFGESNLPKDCQFSFLEFEQSRVFVGCDEAPPSSQMKKAQLSVKVTSL